MQINRTLTLSFSKGRWQSSIFMLLGYLSGLALFISLGNWQLNRASEKQQQLQQLERLSHIAPVIENPATVTDWESRALRPVKLKGYWQPQLFLQDNVTNNHKAGYEVVSPFLSNQTIVLINRGWIAKEELHLLTSSVTPSVVSSMEFVEVEGTWARPLKRFSLIDDLWAQGYPKIVQVMDHQKIAKLLNYPVSPLQIRLAKGAPHGYYTEWKPVYGDPNKHRGYALQWFSFALILTFLYLRLPYKKYNQKV